tara:strand:- start:7398 stop:7880 length:483 start_codon:yes stop_codon:yes gene_type:complete
MKRIEGKVEAKHARVALVVSRFNSFVVERLVEGALDTLKRIGQVQDDNITIVYVPGAYELPMTANRLAMKKEYDAIIALGAVVRGATPHFDFVAGECSSGLAQVMNTHQVPVAFGVITTDTVEQAIDRAGCKVGNKGAEVTLAALEMIDILRQIDAKELV